MTINDIIKKIEIPNIFLIWNLTIYHSSILGFQIRLRILHLSTEPHTRNTPKTIPFRDLNGSFVRYFHSQSTLKYPDLMTSCFWCCCFCYLMLLLLWLLFFSLSILIFQMCCCCFFITTVIIGISLLIKVKLHIFFMNYEIQTKLYTKPSPCILLLYNCNNWLHINESISK